jgi:hypothetical protein
MEQHVRKIRTERQIPGKKKPRAAGGLLGVNRGPSWTRTAGDKNTGAQCLHLP